MRPALASALILFAATALVAALPSATAHCHTSYMGCVACPNVGPSATPDTVPLPCVDAHNTPDVPLPALLAVLGAATILARRVSRPAR